jgi:hypothetical protein
MAPPAMPRSSQSHRSMRPSTFGGAHAGDQAAHFDRAQSRGGRAATAEGYSPSHEDGGGPRRRGRGGAHPNQEESAGLDGVDGHGHAGAEQEEDPASGHMHDDFIGSAEPLVYQAAPGQNTMVIASKLNEMSSIIRSEQEAKFSLQVRVAELCYALDERRLNDEEYRAKIVELSESQKEQQVKFTLLQEQKEIMEKSLQLAKQQLSEMYQNSDKVQAAADGPAVLSMQEKLNELTEALNQAKSQNSEHEKNLKQLVMITKESEQKRNAALEDKKRLEALLLEAKEQLLGGGPSLASGASAAAEAKRKSSLKNGPSFDGSVASGDHASRPSSSSGRPAVQAAAAAASAPRPAAASTPSPQPAAGDLRPQSAGGDRRPPPQQQQPSPAPAVVAQTTQPQPVAAPRPAAPAAAAAPVEPRQTQSAPPAAAVAVQPAKQQPSPAPAASIIEDRPKSAGSEAAAQSAVTTPAKPAGAAAPSNADIEALKAEIMKEDAFLTQVTTLRNRVKDDIKKWLDDFKAEHNREPTLQEKEPIAAKYQAYKEVMCLRIISVLKRILIAVYKQASMLKDQSSAKIKELRRMGRELISAKKGQSGGESPAN